MLKNIFSISQQQEGKIQIKLLGIKINFKSLHTQKMIRQNPYYICKKNNVDIRSVPKAQGQLRDFQLATFYLLKEFDKICKQENITYWIDYGTFLGAVRHKGFIPWDDDIDIGIMEYDLDKLFKAFELNNKNADIYIEKATGDCTKGYLYKVRCKKCPDIFIDIFVNCNWDEELSLKQAKKVTKEIKASRKKYFKNFPKLNSKEIVEQSDIFQSKVMETCKNNSKENGNLMLSSTMTLWYDNWFRLKSFIFPLSEISFEGQTFPCPNNRCEYLTLLYGNYMSYPKKITLRHNGFRKLNEKELENIKELANLAL